MIVEFRCDFCGRRVEREEVTALLLIDNAFAVGAEKKEMQLELCDKCAGLIRRTRCSNPETKGVLFGECRGKGKVLQDGQA